MWVRGLKQVKDIKDILAAKVAPHVGAWIETIQASLMKSFIKSHPMWVRGLKLGRHGSLKVYLVSHPMWVRGLKQSF